MTARPWQGSISPRSAARGAAVAAALAMAFAAAVPATATGIPELVKDIKPGVGSSPSGLVDVGGVLYFAATDPSHGRELWRSDGSPTGTKRVKDIRTGTPSSRPGDLVDLDGTLYFTANDGHGSGLWESDGSAAGTKVVKRLSYLDDSHPVVVGSTLYLRRNMAELWKSDGTTAGTKRVKDLNASGVASIADLIDVDGTLFIVLADVGPPQIWTSDGTAKGTQLVKTIPSAGGEGTRLDELTVVGSTLFFRRGGSLPDGPCNKDLWKSDGTAAGTKRVRDLVPGHPDCVGDLAEKDGALYFSSRDATGGAMWKSDGTAAGTQPVPTVPDPFLLTNAGGTLYFFADHEGASGLWRSDGTGPGTTYLEDVEPTSSDCFLTCDPVAAGGRLFFSAQDEAGDTDLWTSDGTPDGTTLVRDINTAGDTDPWDLTAVGSRVFLTADDGSTGRELWVSDGTEPGTAMVRDINRTNKTSQPGDLTPVGSTLFFAASSNDREDARLWASDGTAAGTREVEEYAADPLELTQAGGVLYFHANDPNGNRNNELYRSDGAPGGTKRVKNINPGAADSTPEWLTNVGGKLFFAADDGSHGRELWRSDGTAAGTTLVKDVVAGGGSEPWDLAAAGGTLYFTATTPTKGRELWKSDGTAAGTKRVKDINPGSAGAFTDSTDALRQLVRVGTKVFFAADDGSRSDELWVSDGTAAGTHLVKDINPTGSSEATDLVNVAGRLYFTARDGDPGHGQELWRSDGTEDGTQRVFDEGPCVDDSMAYPSHLVAAGSEVYFKAFGCETGFELWKSDGTADGTVLVKDINPATTGSSPTLRSWASSAVGSTSSPMTARTVARSGAPTGARPARP